MSKEKCDRCGDLGQDRRTLWMACMYDMQELELPFEKVRIDGVVDWNEQGYTGPKDSLGAGSPIDFRRFYTLRVCKDCRADWMIAIQRWFQDKPSRQEETGTGVWIRDNGSNREATPAEVDELIRRKSSEPGK